MLELSLFSGVWSSAKDKANNDWTHSPIVRKGSMGDAFQFVDRPGLAVERDRRRQREGESQQTEQTFSLKQPLSVYLSAPKAENNAQGG